MTSEMELAVWRAELLVDKSKPKVKIRTSSTSRSRFNKTSSSSSVRLVIFSTLVCLLMIRRLVSCRSYNDTDHHQQQHYQKQPPPAATFSDHQPNDQIQGLVARAGGSATTSELSFEYLGLRHIPSVQLCKLEFQTQVNSVSFASNQIKSINSSAFICISLQLKILNLRNNKIESISEEAFKGLGQLQVLVLEVNQLKELPWRQLGDSHLPSLRHLNLAHNRISSIDASEHLAGSSLISLNLRGNPLGRIHSQSLSGLTKLKTLTLSQVDLQTNHLARFEGLPELRFVHLDQLGDNLSSLDGEFCESSRKLATLSLKLNQLERVPQFTSCQGLLSLDLSYNRIQGTLANNFSRLNNLIDLYLSHNQLEHLDESAFVGLTRLQVLDLDSNRLKSIHSNAFVPLRASLYELNIANNIQLSQLTSNGLERLISLKSYGNNQLRKLPAQFPSARQLVLTFAYHCCDYYDQHHEDHHHHHYQSKSSQNSTTQVAAAGSEADVKLADDAPEPLGDGRPLDTTSKLDGNDEEEAEARFAIHHGIRLAKDDNDEHKREAGSLVARWSNLVLSKLALIWPASFVSRRADDELRLDKTGNSGSAFQPDETAANSRNMSELVLWHQRGPPSASIGAITTPAPAPASAGATSVKTPGVYQATKVAAAAGTAAAAADNTDNDEYFRALNLQQHNSLAPQRLDRLARPEARGARQQRRRRRRLGSVELAATRESAAVIDELIWRASKIRSAHLQDGHQPIRRMTQDDDEDRAVAVDEFQTRANDSVEGLTLNVTTSLELRAELVARALANELSLRYSTINHHRLEEASPTRWTNPKKRAVAERGVAPGVAATSASNDLQDGPPPPLMRSLASGASNPLRDRRASTRVQCLPKPDAFQPCHDLFDSVWLRASIMLVFLFGFAGNIVVIVVLSSVKPSSSTSALTSIMWFNAAQSKRHIDVPRFLVINLAVADLMMAIYLGILAFIDLSTMGEFRLHAIKWQYSTGCKLAGFLAVLSSELSVFILAIITLERNYAITNAVHLNRRLSLQKAMVIMFFGYLYALTMALLPLNGINDYRKFSICLPLDFDPNNWRSASSLYLIVLISINTLSFVLLLSCYLRMYCAIRGSQAWSTNDLKIAKRMSILVVTDFLCWSPIVVVATLALFGYYLVGSEGLKVLIIFVLPLNSVANPFLYAITTKKFKRDLALLKKRLRIEQAMRGLTRAFSYLTPIWRSPDGINGTNALGKHQSASWTVRGDTAAGTGLEQLHCKSATAKKNRKLKRAPLDCRLVMDDTRASGSKQPRARGKAATTTKHELLLVNQNGRSVIANGNSARVGPRLIQFRSTALDQLEEPASGGEEFAATRNDLGMAASSRLLVTHCATCNSKLVPRLQPARPIELSSPDVLLRANQAGLVVTKPESSCESELRQASCLVRPSEQLMVTRPRIVLDSVEPVVDLALAPLRLGVSDHCDGHLLAANGAQQSVMSPDSDTTGQVSQSSMLAHQVACRKFSASDTIDQSQRQALLSHGQQQQNRASSADKPSSGPQLLSLIVSHVDGNQGKHVATVDTRLFQQTAEPTNGSCQTMIVGHDCTNGYRNNPNVSLLDCGLTDMGAPSNRSVSACAFEWPTNGAKRDCGGLNKGNYLTAATPRAGCSCSCDTIQSRYQNRLMVVDDDGRAIGRVRSIKSVTSSQHGSEAPPRGRTRSFSRLVLAPLAKAWSSIQLSLQLGTASAATNSTTVPTTKTAVSPTTSQPQKGTPVTGIPSRLMAESQRGDRIDNDGQIDDDDDELDSESTERDELLVDFHESSIIEDVLQMSSPKRRQLLRGRRMSRSCDVIVETSTTAEPTSSSFYDQNDDQRILLATINQLNSRGRKHGKQASFDRQPDDNQQVHERPSGRRLNCTRCRSWSPALLDKLEDCMHQIRNRIPKFSNRSQTSPRDNPDSAREHNQQSTEACRNDGDPDANRMDKQPSCSSSSQCSSSLNLSEPIDDEEEDEFNEVGLDDWARNMQKKAPPNFYTKSVTRRHRLRQQLSGNSDTLSARTVGTTLTSVSFDSSSNIPATVLGSMESAVHPAVSLPSSSSSSSSLNIAHSGSKTENNNEPRMSPV